MATTNKMLHMSLNRKVIFCINTYTAGSMKSYFKTFLLCLVCTFFIAIYESLFRWRVQKKRKWTMEKKVSETNKIKIFNLEVVIKKEWGRNVKK